MNKIIIKIAAVFAIVFLCDRVIAFIFEKYIFEKTIAKGNVTYLLKRKTNIDFIIMGTSRAEFQFNPGLLTAINGEGYNAGASGAGNVLYVSLLIDIMINAKIVPKTLLLQLDAIGFVKEVTNKELIPLYPFYDLSPKLQLYTRGLGLPERFKLLFKMYRFNGQVPGIISNFVRAKQTAYYNGFVASPDVFDTTKRRTLPYPENVSENFIEARLTALNSIFEQCQENHIKLFIVFPPTYNNNVYRQQDHLRLLQYIRSKSTEPIIDMADVRKFKDLQSNINWKDANHMNNIGATKFCNYLNDSLMQYRASTMKPN